MKKAKWFIRMAGISVLVVALWACDNSGKGVRKEFAHHAETLWKNTLTCFKADSCPEGVSFFCENYVPAHEKKISRTGTDEPKTSGAARLWVVSSVISAANSLWESTHDRAYGEWLEKVMVPMMECHWDTTGVCAGFRSEPQASGKTERYYDDNTRIGMEFLKLYRQTGNKRYLEKSVAAWNFQQTGMDDTLGGGIYWKENRKDTKHVCTNAPASVFSLKLYQATQDKKYLDIGKSLYHWTKRTLQDPADGLYYDNIQLDGSIEKTKYTYNSGQMMQAASLLYVITRDPAYLDDAQRLAESCSRHFFTTVREGDSEVVLLKNGSIWFTAILMRGFEELYKIDGNSRYIDVFRNTLIRLWTKGQDKTGLFNSAILSESFHFANTHKWLQTQGALIEMYARLAGME